MAIKVNGTTVIDDSRNMSNVGTVTATSFAGSGASLTNIPSTAPGPDFNPNSPTATYTSSGSWSKPGSVGDNDWVVFYLVGGGGGGSNNHMWGTGGGGGGAAIVSAIGANVPSSVSFTIGAGGAKGSSSSAAPGGNTTMNIGGVTYTCNGGRSSQSIGGTTQNSNGANTTQGGAFNLVYNGNPTNVAPNGSEFNNGGAPGQISAPECGTFGGGGGGGGYTANQAGGTSTYAGNGGQGRAHPSSSTGQTHGGGGGGTNANDNNYGNGGVGSLRIYY